MSEPYRADNLLDRLTQADTLQVHYDQEMRRERQLLDRHLRPQGGDVLSVGCGRHPGRHLFPRYRFRMTGVDLDAGTIADLLAAGELDEGEVGRAGELTYADRSFDIVLYRLVLHHLAFQGPLQPVLDEAARLLRPGGVLVAVEPSSWHPWAPAWRWPTGSAWARGLTAHPTTFRSLRGRSCAVPGSRARARALRVDLRLAAPAALSAACIGSTVWARARAPPFAHTLFLIARA